ncbi:MAG: hypothetical protein J0I47_03540 [Sphingomonas sp.]|uniref:DUF6628 family protein n=1 Tax=Sphingomonas sp. TaxID=28214 RepID=UPI001ACF97BD|nr:DUF6628 family protein [Sphingomonas sp.]MBN8807299.1 hypothetical protein [Sphingomonas sp.]
MTALPAPAPAPAPAILPHALPDATGDRLMLLAIRRMGAHGLADAAVAQRYLMAFGPSFRRPLVLARAFMAELAATATTTIPIAPCCCQRMTSAEAAILTAIGHAERRPETARLLLADVMAERRADAILASAAALSAAFADLGLPIGG